MHRICGSCLTFLFCLSACLAAETELIRLSDSVGDAIDAAERDRYGLFPGVQRFQDARFLLAPDSTILAVITTGEPGARVSVIYHLSSLQLERIRFLVTSSDYVRSLTAQNPDAAQALQRFWADIERTGVTDRFAQYGWDSPVDATGASWLDKKFTTLTGATVGSGLGGWLATSIATKKVAERVRTAQEPNAVDLCISDYDCMAGVDALRIDCGPDCGLDCGSACGKFACWDPTYMAPTYRTNWTVYYGTYVGVTALGAGLGYVLGRDDDSRLRGGESWDETDETGGCGRLWDARSSWDEEEGGWSGCGKWTTRCLYVLPGLVLGGLYWSWASTLHGREDGAVEIENGNELQMVPAVITGVCIAIDLTLLAHKLTKAIGLNRAARRSRVSPAQYAQSHPEAMSVTEGPRPSDTLSAESPKRTP